MHQQTPSMMGGGGKLSYLNDEHLEKTSTKNMVPEYEKLIGQKKCIISHYPRVNTKYFTD
jgi:hypothetical protein